VCRATISSPFLIFRNFHILANFERLGFLLWNFIHSPARTAIGHSLISKLQVPDVTG
jgi:hypothetical protein